MRKFKNFFFICIVFVALFLSYDYYFTHFYKTTEKSEIVKEVSAQTGLPEKKIGFTVNNSKIKSLIDGKAAFPVIEQLINSAKQTLFIEIFIFHYDKTGLRIADLLAKKKKEGVDVKLLIDSSGLKFGKDDNKIVDKLKAANVDVQIFNDKYFSKTGLNITHRKMILADGQTVMVGGMNFGDEYEHEWHDSMFEVKGQVAQELQKDFLYDWKRANGKLPAKILTLPNQNYGSTKIKVIKTNVTPDDTSHQIHQEILGLINNAKTRVLIESPYFSDNEVIQAVIKAKKRNLKVQVIMPKHNNHSVFKDLNLYTAKMFVDVGIEVYFYKPVFSHLKALVADDKTIVGSANIDERSFTGNQEICILVYNKEFSEEISSIVFEKDIKLSEKVNKNTLKINPIKKSVIKTLEVFDYYL